MQTKKEHKQRRWRRFLKLTAGWSFILLGIAGLILPFLQGIFFLLIGLLLLSHELPWAERLLQRIKLRWPWVGKKIDEAEDYVANFVHTLVTNPKALMKHVWLLLIMLVFTVLSIVGLLKLYFAWRAGDISIPLIG